MRTHTLRLHHSGLGIRVPGGAAPLRHGILIREAPNVAYLVGSISSRPKGDHAVCRKIDGNPRNALCRKSSP